MSRMSSDAEAPREKRHRQLAQSEADSVAGDLAFGPSPSESLERLTGAPNQAVRLSDISALQSTVGNRIVNGIVQSQQPAGDAAGPIQRRFVPPSTPVVGKHFIDEWQDSAALFNEMGLRARGSDPTSGREFEDRIELQQGQMNRVRMEALPREGGGEHAAGAEAPGEMAAPTAAGSETPPVEE